MKRYEKYGRRLSDLGYDVTPLRGKVPILKGWQSRPDTALEFEKHGDANIGVVLGGPHNIIAVDIDVLDSDAAATIRTIAEDILGLAPERVGNAPKTLLIYRCTQAIKKIKTGIFDINGDSCVEALGSGQQVAVSGQHPGTLRNYVWPGDSILDYAPEDLTPVSPQNVATFMQRCHAALLSLGPLKSSSAPQVALVDAGETKFEFQANELGTSIEKLRAASAYLANNDLHYDDWVKIAHAYKAAIGEDGRGLFHEFSAKSGKYDDAETDRLWDSIGSVTKIGAGSLYHMAAEHGFDITTWDRKFGPDDLQNDTSPDEFDGWDSEDDGTAEAGDGSFTAASVVGPIADREWVLEGWFPTRTVSMLFGAGGVGKTLLMQQFANAVADGEQFLGVNTTQMPVLSVMCEDDADEVKRRQLSINQSRSIDEFGTAPENLTLWPRVGFDNVICRFPTGADEPGEFYGELCRKVEEIRGDAEDILLILDTAADHFGGNENVRLEVNQFLKRYLGAIAVKYGATVILLAHPSLQGMKSSGLSGSTAWENSVRSRSFLHRDEDSDDIRILSRKKSNYSDISGSHDIKLIWESGVLAIPTSQDALDRINLTSLKHEIMAEVDIAFGEKNGIRKQGLRSYKAVLPRQLPHHKPAAIVKAFNALAADGNVVYIDKLGFKTEKSV
tara:strand:- start:924 stop:2939 length:2016 start_codon:yes stop_codon:yes gene_type:complete